MKFITPITNVIIPTLSIPEGYEIREATGSKEDRRAWDMIIKTFRVRKYPEGEEDRVWFAYHEGKPVGFESVVVPERRRVVYMSTGVVLREHQKKGLHTAMTHYRLKYAKETGRTHIRVACRAFLDDWWRRHLIEQPDT